MYRSYWIMLINIIFVINYFKSFMFSNFKENKNYELRQNLALNAFRQNKVTHWPPSLYFRQQRPSYHQFNVTVNTKDWPVLHTEPQLGPPPPTRWARTLQYRHITDTIYYLHNRHSLRVYQSFCTSYPYCLQLLLTCSLSATHINHAKIRWLNLYKRLG